MRYSAVFGGVVWALVGAVLALRRGPWWLIETLFLLAPLVLVPLALGATGLFTRARALRILQPFGAFGAAVSFVLPNGPWAGALAASWCGVTLLLAAHAFERLRQRGLRDPPEIAIDAACLFLPVGGGWLVLSRLGATPMGFEEPIVLLTAVHFHYAAFTALTLVGLAGRAHRGGLGYRAIVAGMIVGIPMLAAGITLSRTAEMLGASLLAASLLAFAAWVLRRVAPQMPVAGARILLSVSALSLPLSMTLALLYAWGRVSGRLIVTISTLAAVHGTLNALGFGLCGLLAWTAIGGGADFSERPPSAPRLSSPRRSPGAPS